MSHPVLLNNVDHQQLRVHTGRGARFGDAVMTALTFPAEFRDIQAHYPIVFRKLDGGVGFEPLALFGFRDGDNLFLDGARWDGYVPLSVARQPFLIGRNGDELLVHIDLAHPRVSATDGEALFLEHGGSTEYLERINSTLLTIHQGLQATAPFVAALLEHALLESFVLDVEADDGGLHRLAGFYTISEERLASLDGTALAQLHQRGYLQAIYMVLASLSNLRALIERQRRADARPS